MAINFDTILHHLNLPSPLQKFRFSFWEPSIYIKRDDLIHPKVSGNKWRKLEGLLTEKKDQNINRWISFGGPFSNHVLALSYVAKWCGISLHVYIRGEPHYLKNPTLQEIVRQGTSIEFIPRHQYRSFIENYSCSDLQTLIIPEGGSHKNSRLGMQNLMNEIHSEVDLDRLHSLWVACGTGGTLGGIMHAKTNHLTCYGVSVVNDPTLPNRIEEIAGKKIDDSVQLIWPESRMGHRPLSQELKELMKRIYDEHRIKLDPIYTSRLFWSLNHYLHHHNLTNEDEILVIHTGGLSGLQGYEYLYNQKIYP